MLRVEKGMYSNEKIGNIMSLRMWLAPFPSLPPRHLSPRIVVHCREYVTTNQYCVIPDNSM